METENMLLHIKKRVTVSKLIRETKQSRKGLEFPWKKGVPPLYKGKHISCNKHVLVINASKLKTE